MNNKYPLISIIVPIYNNESTIERCIESLIKQTLKNIEIIIVNNGSTDKSGQIIDKMQKRDSRVQVINETNNGVSSARNAGIKRARGSFIGFVDSDDYVDYTMYEKLYDLSQSKSYDLVMCKFCKIMDGINKEEVWNLNMNNAHMPQYIFSNMIIGEREGKISIKDTIMGSTCRCIYKKDILEKHNIFFNEKITYAEDLIFNLNYLKNIKSTCLLNESLYYYKVRNSSLSLGYRDDFYEEIKKLMNIIENISINCNINKYIGYAWLKYLTEALRNVTKEIKICDIERYRKFKYIAKDIENKKRLKEVELKNLTYKEKLFYIILNNNIIVMRIMFYVIRYLKKYIN